MSRALDAAESEEAKRLLICAGSFLRYVPEDTGMLIDGKGPKQIRIDIQDLFDHICGCSDDHDFRYCRRQNPVR